MMVVATELFFYILLNWSFIMVLSYPFCQYIAWCFSVGFVHTDSKGAMTLWMHMWFHSCNKMSLQQWGAAESCFVIGTDSVVCYLFVCFFHSFSLSFLLSFIELLLPWSFSYYYIGYYCVSSHWSFLVSILWFVYFCFCYPCGMCLFVWLLVGFFCWLAYLLYCCYINIFHNTSYGFFQIAHI